MNIVKVLLGSNRVKAIAIGLLTAFFQKYAPDLMPSEETVNWIFGLLITFVAADTVRPVDPDKPTILGTIIRK